MFLSGTSAHALTQIRVLNVYYWTAHMATTVGTLLLVFFLRSSMYQVRHCTPLSRRAHRLFACASHCRGHDIIPTAMLGVWQGRAADWPQDPEHAAVLPYRGHGAHCWR